MQDALTDAKVQKAQEEINADSEKAQGDESSIVRSFGKVKATCDNKVVIALIFAPGL